MRTAALAAALLVTAFAAAALPGDDVPVPPAPKVAAASEQIAIGGQLPADLLVLPVPHGGDDSEVALASLGGDTVKPLVVLFWSSRCPVCRRYASALKALAKDYDGRARVALVFSNATEPEAEVRGWIDAAGVASPAALDRGQEAASRLGAVVTPTALVFDGAGALRYRGPVDDDRRNRRRDTTDHLRVALESVLSGKSVENPEPRAFGSSLRRHRADQR